MLNFKRGLTLAFLALMILAVSAPWAVSQQEGAIPAYNAGPPAKGTALPPILGKEQLWGENAQYPFQSHAYELAAKIPAVLYQQPCYCYCDRGMGHNSLAQLLRRHPRGSVFGLSERAVLLLLHESEEKDSRSDSSRNYEG